MSRIGKQPIKIPVGVEMSLDSTGREVSVRSAVGSVSRTMPDILTCKIENGFAYVVPSKDLSKARGRRELNAIKSYWGLYRKLLANDVQGLSEGFTVFLDISGVGYKAAVDQGARTIALYLGYSHDLIVRIPEGVQASCAKNVTLELKGRDKRVLGDFAARLESYRLPDVYNLKGIMRRGRFVVRKEGKAG